MRLLSSLCGGLSLLMLVSSVTAQDQEPPTPLLNQAQQCTTVSERLERLRCFDHVFNTPTHRQAVHIETTMSATWLRATQAASQADAQTHMSLNYVGEADAIEGDAWLTLTAINNPTPFANNAKPIMMLSCIDRLSRIELILPQEIPDARVKVSLVGNGTTQYWRSDDTGYLLLSGRGIPAIDMMKHMATERRSTLRSNSKLIDGLTFNTESLPSVMKTLRQRCRW
jgi:type VI secretion system protein VasI